MARTYPRHHDRRPNHIVSTGDRINANFPIGRRHNHGSGPATRIPPLRGRDGVPQGREHSRLIGNGSQEQSTDSRAQGGVTSMESDRNPNSMNASTVDQSNTDLGRGPIHVVSFPVAATTSLCPAPKGRPENTYRGKNIVKKLVQNKKLQAILLDKNPYKVRKKAAAERPVLRQGMGKPTK